MIAALRGEVIHIGLDHGVIDCAGVGYKFLATPKRWAPCAAGNKPRFLLTWWSRKIL
ncbi:OB-fold domain-containing protein [Corynebacterium tuberculostearicum]|uniref:OB-fold domain-containing protein n=1 Tax=Corynebacterium TaxID=1716 RepID=UPI0038D20E4A